MITYRPRLGGALVAGHFPAQGGNIAEHRRELKVAMLRRDGFCLGCGTDEIDRPEMHEGIVSRNDVRGWKAANKILIHSPYNCLILCSDCNQGLSGKTPPSRREVVLYMCLHYGYDVIRWLEYLPFKAHPMRGLLEMVEKFGFYAGVVKWAQ